MNVANRYHDLGFPLDGMHLDVDFQVSLGPLNDAPWF